MEPPAFKSFCSSYGYPKKVDVDPRGPDASKMPGDTFQPIYMSNGILNGNYLTDFKRAEKAIQIGDISLEYLRHRLELEEQEKDAMRIRHEKSVIAALEHEEKQKKLQLQKEAQIKAEEQKKEREILQAELTRLERKKAEETNTGIIYCLSNQSFPELLKIGFTKKTAEERAKELFKTGTPTPFKVEFSKKVTEPESKESMLHSVLEKYRTNSSREFFQVSLEWVRTLFDKIDGEYVI